MNALVKGLIVGVAQLVLIAGVGGKFLYDRAHYPRVWAETAPYDPDLPIRGRYVNIALLVETARAPAPEEGELPPVFMGRLEILNDRLATDGHLWAENYDRELTAANIFAIQSEVATAIANTLNATLTAGEKARVSAVPTQSLEAWEAYQLGKQRMAKRTSDALTDAERFFQRAIGLDPNFALAYAGLAETYYLRAEFGDARWDANSEKGEQAAAKALELDPNLAEAWVSFALGAMFKGQDARTEQALRRAIQLNPHHAGAYDWLSWQAIGLGRGDEALALAG